MVRKRLWSINKSKKECKDMQKSKRVGIIVCNYNKEDKVLDCIQSLLEQKYTDYDIYVVDNASTDNSVKAINEKYGDRIELIVNNENLGGSGGFNTGLRRAYAKGYQYLMCVDNDAMLDEKAVGNLVSFLDEHDEVGMAASKIYNLEEPDYIQQYGQTIDFEHFCAVVPQLNMFEDGTMPDYMYVDSVPACSLMVRRTTIDKIGFLPEDNFLYWDDTEWCYLCNRAGMKVASVGTSKALHAMGARREDINTFPTYYAWRNWISFFAKYTPIDRQDKMAETFLNSIFLIIYSGIHKGEYNKMKTVMLAYDDAIHGVMGTAGDNRIFDIDFNPAPYKKLFSSGESFYIEEGEFPNLAGWLRNLPSQLGVKENWVTNPSKDAKAITLCYNIFEIDDLSLSNIYIDVEHCILQDEDDVLDVINYNYSKRSFIMAQKPVFLQKIKELAIH
jgi:hypothetical protein